MGFDSIPFEEPELFRVRSGLRPALKSLAKDCTSLELQLDSQLFAAGNLDDPDQASPESALCGNHVMSASIIDFTAAYAPAL